MKKTLIVTTHFPLPESTGGDMRTMHFARFFQSLGSVDIAYSYPGRGPAGDGGFGKQLQLPLAKGIDLKAQLVLGALKRRPYPLYLYSDEARRALNELIEASRYDHILIRSLYPSGAVFDLKEHVRHTVLLDLDDSLSGSLYDQTIQGTEEGSLRARVFELNRKLLQRHERRAVRSVSRALVCSEADRARLTFDQPNKPEIVPNIYQAQDSESREISSGFANPMQLLFVGTLNYAPNIEGLRWFLKTIFPMVRERYPNARLSVVGRHPGEDVRTLCTADGVDLWADAPDILTHYASSRAVVVPLLSGGGTRIKILEAATARRPVLSTRQGAEGLDLEDDRDLLFFENAEEFLAAYAKLADSARYESLVENARGVVESKYSKDAFRASMVRLIGGE